MHFLFILLYNDKNKNYFITDIHNMLVGIQ